MPGHCPLNSDNWLGTTDHGQLTTDNSLHAYHSTSRRHHQRLPGRLDSLDVAASISDRLAQQTIAAQVDGVTVDSMRPLEELSDADPDPADAAHHSRRGGPRRVAALVCPCDGAGRHAAVRRSRPRVRPDHRQRVSTTTSIWRLRSAKRISRASKPRCRRSSKRPSRSSGSACRGRGGHNSSSDLDQELKTEHIQTGLAEHETLSFYRQGEFVDLCRGPHIPDAGKIKAFKLLSVAGSYWKGDASNKHLQRLYGTAFFDKKQMNAYLEQVEEAKRRDHRVLGKQHGLFAISNDVGSGLCLWLPKGATVRALLEDFIKQELLKRGYEPVYSPHIGRVEMYETSGHFPYYRESQFPPLFGHPAGQLVDYWKTKLDEGDARR